MEMTKEELLKKAVLMMVPGLTAKRLIDYMFMAVEPGEFLYAVLINDLQKSFGLADMINNKHMSEIVAFIWNYFPAGCHGSREKVAAWTGINAVPERVQT